MRDYSHLDEFYSELIGDVYLQPMDEGHFKEMNKIITQWIAPLGISSVLDVGCGNGDAKEIFNRYGIVYYGVTAEKIDKEGIEQGDYNFLEGGNYDLVFSRHSLEHSPFPLLSLMEWHRVSNHWLAVVLPNPDHYTFVGRNHYSVMSTSHAVWILRRAGWKLNRIAIWPTELWFLCEKRARVSFEGWKELPLGRNMHDFERDLKDSHGEVYIPESYRNS